MPRFDIDSYRANFQGGARQNLFYIKPNFPAGVEGANTETATFLVRTANLPETMTEEVITNWQGFDFKMASKYTFPDWTVTFNVDVEANIQKMFINWANLIHDPTSNIYNTPANYMADQQLELLGFDGSPILKYKLVAAWPKSIGNVTLDYSSTDVAQFDVTFSYLYHVVDKAGYDLTVTFA